MARGAAGSGDGGDRPGAETLGASGLIYHNMMRFMVYLHDGMTPSQAYSGLLKEPSFPQFKALLMVRHMGPTTVKALARGLGISSAAASEMVDRLVDLDLLDRRRDTRDRRRVQITLTRRAVKSVQRFEAQIQRRIEKVMCRMGAEPAGQWVEAFERLGEMMDDLSAQPKHQGMDRN